MQNLGKDGVRKFLRLPLTLKNVRCGFTFSWPMFVSAFASPKFFFFDTFASPKLALNNPTRACIQSARQDNYNSLLIL